MLPPSPLRFLLREKTQSPSPNIILIPAQFGSKPSRTVSAGNIAIPTCRIVGLELVRRVEGKVTC
ncbi:hypothetical protein TIFTF001_029539 [Ficus carica]|uniref:Uncharacterized protein n=1 Tax=Ficus carica TaxID=3494 RepID=A0AA88DS77_FICCA|nr:hypothetical protein TIFTF001_029539 [Ficus carica]